LPNNLDRALGNPPLCGKVTAAPPGQRSGAFRQQRRSI